MNRLYKVPFKLIFQRSFSSKYPIPSQPIAATSTEVSDLTNVAVEGYVIKGLNIFVGETDPVIKADSEYPQWMWDTLKEPKLKELAQIPLVSPEDNPLLFKRQQKAIRRAEVRRKKNKCKQRNEK